MYTNVDVYTAKVALVLGLLNGRNVVSIYDNFHSSNLLWSGYVEEVPDAYKTYFVFSMKHNGEGYQLYI